MSSTSPIKAIQNGLRKYKLTASALDIRQAAQELNLDVTSDDCIEPLIDHFVVKGQDGSIIPTDDVSLEQIESLKQLVEEDTQVPQESVALTNSQKTDIITSQATEMGVTLSASDIQTISDHISGQGTDTDELNNEIRSAISAYIQYHKAQNLGRVSKLVKEVYKEQSEANREVSQALASGLQQFSRDMEESRQHTKSSVRLALQCFAIPSTEAQG